MSQVNAHKPGYKHTPLGWIPKEWEIRELNAIVKAPIVYGIVQAGPETKDGLPYIKSSDVGGEIITQQLSKTSFEIASKYRRSEVVPGDIVFSLRGNIGELSVVPSTLLKANLTQGTARISISDQHDFAFIRYALKSPITSKNIAIKAKGSTFKEISLEQLRTLSIAIPSKEEQQKIATILSTWDEAITQTQQLIAKLQERNKGLMQELLTGKKRLPGFTKDWRHLYLGEVFTERIETNRGDLPLLSITAERGVIHQSEGDKKDTSNEDKSKYRRICIGDIGYNTMRMWQGRSALSSMEGIVSPAYTIVTPKVCEYSLFYAFLFKLPKVVNKFFRNSQGLVDDTLNCKFKDFAIVKLKVPDFEEQVAIAELLREALNEIEIHKQKLNKLHNQKKGLMQKLLTGEVRVN